MAAIRGEHTADTFSNKVNIPVKKYCDCQSVTRTSVPNWI